jgi:catechol 2,3-dioxygenase-like lactoylglutathione lyase family enzyme
MAPFPAPETGILLTHFIVSEDVARSRDFYADVLGGETVSESPAFVALANSWIIIDTGGGPTDDTPTATIYSPAEGATYELGQSATTNFACAKGGAEPASSRVPPSVTG